MAHFGARLGIIWRIALTLVAALIVLMLVLVALSYRERSQATGGNLNLPLLDQVAAAVTLLDHAPGDQRQLILRAINGLGVHAAVAVQRPEDDDRDRPLPRMQRLLAGYLGDASNRLVSVRLTAGNGLLARGLPVPPPSRLTRGRLRIVVGLADGTFLVVDSSDDLMARLFGLPVGFWAAIIGFGVAAVALLAVVREALPLTRLAHAVTRFGAALEPAPMPERGAREVRLLIHAVNQMQARISTLVKGRTFVIGAIAHDLRTYLTRLRLRIETLPDGETRDGAVRDVEDMQALLEDALAFARSTVAGGERQPVNLADLVRREAEMALGVVTVTVPDAPVMVLGSLSGLTRVLGNLVENALKYGHEAVLTLSADGTMSDLTVDDAGPGIPASERERIFEPFYRLEGSRNRQQGGTGLGLAIARQLAESDGGTLTVEERPGGGARFRVRLPLSRAP